MTNQGMKDLIRLINKLQDASSMAGLPLGEFQLPQIAVVGGQSAGKSSVLENFVGRDFLPRGSGIVTRRPLILQLMPSSTEYAEFLHLPNTRFTDFSKVRDEIVNETIRVTGNGKGVSKIPINLHIYSPNVLELTLVDLPGMTRVAVNGQPPDIEEQIRDMILDYIENENTLILAVSPANLDLANSDALNLAGLVDPEGERTIGVITKLDLMDKGTDARDVLENRVYPLQRGYVGLVNRSQQDIDTCKNIVEAQRDEMEFFLNHPAYRHIATRMGSKYLQQVLNKQLCEHIKKKLPQLSSDIKQKHSEVHQQLDERNFFDSHTEEWKHVQLVKLLQQFSEDLRTSLEGHSLRVTGFVPSAGAKINACFHNDIDRLLIQAVKLNENEIATVAENLQGFRDGLFPSPRTFDKTCMELIQNYRSPMLRSVDIISAILSESISDCAKKLSEFPALKEKVISLLSIRLQRQEKKTKKHMETHVDAQAAFMNIKNPEFERITNPSQVPPRKSALEDTIDGDDYDDIYKEEDKTVVLTLPENSQKNRPIKAQVIQKGWILRPITNLMGNHRSKNLYFVLSLDTLSWYKDEEERKLNGTTSTAGLKLLNNSKTRKFTLLKPGKALTKEIAKMQLIFKDDKDEEIWINSFKRAGIKMDEDNSDTPFTEDVVDDSLAGTEEDMASPPQKPRRIKLPPPKPRVTNPDILRTVNMIIPMVESYMKIVDKTIRELVPKYIVLHLINAITDYVKYSLIAEITKDRSCLEFMEEGSEEAEKTNKLKKIYDATSNALAILNDVSFSI